MFDWFYDLRDPKYVATFQRAFGVELVNSDVAFLLSQPDSPAGSSSNEDSISSLKKNLASRLKEPKLEEGFNAKFLPFSRSGSGSLRISNGFSGHSRQASTLSLDSQADSVRSVTDSENESTSETTEDRVHYIINNYFWYYYFSVSASFGNEIFLMMFYPFWFWNMDGYVARRMVMTWAVVMYLGQVTKDIICWPRPLSPPVVRLETLYQLEHGMPSTHAMAAFCVPFVLVWATIQRYEFPHVPLICIGILWTVSVASSRLYLGMHSISDILAGLTFSVLIVAVILPWLDVVDIFVLTTDYGVYVPVLVGFVCCLFYPPLDPWNTCRGDTFMVIAIASGMLFGARLNYLQGYLTKFEAPPPYPIEYPTFEWLGPVLLRFALGLVVLVSTRFVMKVVSYRVFCWCFGVDHKDRESNLKLLKIELPYKFFTYGSIAFNALYTAPLLFRLVNMERETYYTEL